MHLIVVSCRYFFFFMSLCRSLYASYLHFTLSSHTKCLFIYSKENKTNKVFELDPFFVFTVAFFVMACMYVHDIHREYSPCNFLYTILLHGLCCCTYMWPVWHMMRLEDDVAEKFFNFLFILCEFVF